MVGLRRSGERGQTKIDWLQSWHTFSFGEYYDPAHHHFGVLRVINDDIIAPGGGFGTHPHRDMEILTYILTYVLTGTLEHRDSMGNGSIIRAGQVQRMTAGTGITHSEFNPSSTEAVHLLQIWVFPKAHGLVPGYEEKAFSNADKRGRWCLIASDGEHDGSVHWNQDVNLYATKLPAGQSLPFTVEPDRMTWLHLATGSVRVNGVELHSGDAIALREPAVILVEGITPSELLRFDVKKD